FWLRSCVVSVLISLIAYTVLIEDLRLTSIFLGDLSMPSAPGNNSFLATAAAANGPNSAPLNQLSPFISPTELTNQGISSGHMQLRSSSPMDLQQQRQAVEEVVMLLKEHKRRNRGAGQDRSGGSGMGSNAGGNNTVQSPNSDTAPTGPAGAVHVSGLGASALGTNNSSTSTVLPYNVGNISRFVEEPDAMGAYGLGSGCCGGGGIGHSSFSEACAESIQQQQMMARMAGSGGEAMGGGARFCTPMYNTPNVGQTHPSQTLTQPQSQPLSRMPPASQQTGPMSSGPLPKLSLPTSCEPLQQLQLPLGQSHSHPLMQMPASYNYQQVSLIGQQPMQATGGGGGGGGNGLGVCHQTASSMVPYTSMSSLSLSGPFYSAVSSLPGVSPCAGGVGGGGGILSFAGHNSGPNALGGGALGATGFGCGQHHSASWAMDRGASATSAQNVVAIHHGLQANGAAAAAAGTGAAAGAAAGVGLLVRPDDLPDDFLMSLDEYVPEDL
ncbi:hypothetical protein Vretifemale_19333, partial [Volvox reticuliferus]